MELKEAINTCHVRSAIFRRAKPRQKYWKNHRTSLEDRIPYEDKSANDWEEYDPRDYDDCSLFIFND